MMMKYSYEPDDDGELQNKPAHAVPWQAGGELLVRAPAVPWQAPARSAPQKPHTKKEEARSGL